MELLDFNTLVKFGLLLVIIGPSAAGWLRVSPQPPFVRRSKLNDCHW